LKKKTPSAISIPLAFPGVELIRLLGGSGGYILGPAHVIQAGTPAENILAMFDTALETEL
jgi:hypothetical protein